MNKQRIASLAAAGLLVFTNSAVAQTEVPNEFQAGQPARAAEVNENFEVLEQAVQALEGSASTTRQQVLTGIAIASEARWMLVDVYRRNGFWPADNASAGLAAPNNYNNAYVESVSVEFQVITVTFGDKIDSSLAGAQLEFNAIDNAGSVEFECSWDAILDDYLSDDDCVFVDSPPPHIEILRSTIARAIDSASGTRWLVIDYYLNNGVYPDSNDDVGLPPPDEIVTPFVTSIGIEADGAVRLRLRGSTWPLVLLPDILFVPEQSPSEFDPAIEWECVAANVLTRYMVQYQPITDCVTRIDEIPVTLGTVRDQVNSAFPVAEIFQEAVAEYYAANGVLPQSNADLGLPPPTDYRTDYLQAAGLGLGTGASGAIDLVFGDQAASDLFGGSVTLTPQIAGTAVFWTCTTSGMDLIYQPYSCRF